MTKKKNKNKIDISSTALEKGIDLAKKFVDRMIMPSVEETGLLLKDQVTRWRFNNQIKILNKSKSYCEANGIDPKTISLKILCPLLEYAGLEEDEELQSKWSILLGNMVDSEQNIENHVFPYLLSQISNSEFSLLETAFQIKVRHFEAEKLRLEEYQAERPTLEDEVDKQIVKLTKEINILSEATNNKFSSELWELKEKKKKLEQRKNNFEWKERIIISSMNEPMQIPHDEIEEYELSNLIRLGAVKIVIPQTYISPQELEIPNPHPEFEYHREYLTVQLDLEIESELETYVLTELGELFIKACTKKKTNEE